jgi:hypothetical protein
MSIALPKLLPGLVLALDTLTWGSIALTPSPSPASQEKGVLARFLITYRPRLLDYSTRSCTNSVNTPLQARG